MSYEKKRNAYVSKKHVTEREPAMPCHMAQQQPCSEVQWPAGQVALLSQCCHISSLPTKHHLPSMPGPSGKPRKPIVEWEQQFSSQTDCLVEWCNTNPTEHLRLFAHSSQTAWKEGQPKETNNQSKKAIYILLAQAIFLYDESANFRNMCPQDPAQFISVIE